jgi:hypothetical protein
MVALVMAQQTNKPTTNLPDGFSYKAALRSGLVDDTGLLEALFPDERSRPSERWLRKMRTKRLIPCVKIGHRFVRYNVREVEAALAKQFTREAKYL